MDVYATNEIERLFSILILFWALLALSSIIGSVTASMTALRNMSSEQNKMFWVLRRFLRQKNVSLDLQDRMTRYLEYQQQNQSNLVPKASVTLLKKLSDSLELELAHEMYSVYLQDHPFFHRIRDDDNIELFLWRVCHLALKSIQYAEDNIAFSAGDEAMSMYFIQNGSFDYKLVDKDIVNVDAPLGSKAWASEPVLWTVWRHRGSLIAKKVGSLLAISPSGLSSQLKLHPRTSTLARQYAEKFVKYLNVIGIGQVNDLTYEPQIWRDFVTGSDTYTSSRPRHSKTADDKIVTFNSVDGAPILGREEEESDRIAIL
jgi:hypothetical protein